MDIFISYARSAEPAALAVEARLGAMGYRVWRDDQLPAHRTYGEVIEEKLAAAKAVVVVWTADGVKSQWVRAEADFARQAGTLVQMSVDGARLPLPFNQLECADLAGWSGDGEAAGWLKVVGSIGELVGSGARAAADVGKRSPAAPAGPRTPLLAVLPFDNLSRDDDLLYFADGVSEEILQTVASTTPLKVVGRCSSFQFRGADKAVRRVAAELNCTHVLDGSLRRAGERVRINAHLIECATQTTLWSERFDRDLSDVFALQDEIAEKVAAALNAAFAPSARTTRVDPAAYDLYLRARNASPSWLAGRFAAWLGTYDAGLLRQALAKAPDFARALAALAMTRAIEQPSADEPFEARRAEVEAAAERALSLDPSLGAGYAALASLQPALGHFAAIEALLDKALGLSPDDPDVLTQASMFLHKVGRLREGAAHAARAYEIDPLRLQSQCWHAMSLLQTGRDAEAMALFERGWRQSPHFDMFADFPLMHAAGFGEWAEVDRIIGEIPEGVPSGEHRAAALNGVGLLRNPGPGTAAVCRGWGEMQLAASGRLSMPWIALSTWALGPDEVHAMLGRADYAPVWQPGGRLDNEDPGTLILFQRRSDTTLRHDPRFVGLCHRLGLAQYWAATGRWPDCVAEVAGHYDFMAEVAKVVAAGG